MKHCIICWKEFEDLSRDNRGKFCSGTCRAKRQGFEVKRMAALLKAALAVVEEARRCGIEPRTALGRALAAFDAEAGKA